MTAVFEGKATVTPDPASMSCLIEGKGVDRAGGSRGQVKVNYDVSAAGIGSTVNVDADVLLSGAAAQFGRTGLIKEMSKRLIGEFVECLEAKLQSGSAEEAAQVSAGEVRGISLFLASVWNWVKSLFGRRS